MREECAGTGVRIEHRQESGPLLNDAHAGVAMAVDAAFVAFWQSERAFEIIVVGRQIRIVISDKETGGESVDDVAEEVSHRQWIIAERLAKVEEGRSPLFEGAGFGVEILGNFLNVRKMQPDLGLCGLDMGQTAVDTAYKSLLGFVGRAPFFATRLRCKESRTCCRESAMRNPGGCSGPP